MKNTAKKGSVGKSRRPGVTGKTADGGVYRRVHRSKLQAAAFNPRVMDPIAARRLRESIQRSGGLIEPPVWNERTGHIVGGHKRLEAMDTIQGTDDYYLTVCVVNLPENEEIETNIRLNSPLLQGDYDAMLLDDLLVRPDVELEFTGLDLSFLENLHVEQEVDLPREFMAPEDLESDQAIEDEGIDEDLAEALDEVDQAEADEQKQAEIDEWKRRKAHFKQQEAFTHQTGLSFRVVCPSDKTCAALMEALGKAVVKNSTGDYVDGMILAEALGIREKLQKILKEERPGKLKDFKLDKTKGKNDSRRQSR